MKTKTRIFILAIVIMAIIISIMLIEQRKPERVVIKDSNVGLTIGKIAPNFELEDIFGKKIQLNDFRGKAILLNFWASWCAPCRLEMPEFQKIYETNQDEIVVIGVNLQENKADIENFIKKLDITFPILLDPDSKVKSLYDIFTQPVTYFIDKNGKIVDKKFGPLTVEEIYEKVGNIKRSTELQMDEIKTLPDGTKYIIHPSKFLSGGPPKDGIPSIDNPKFISANQADWLSDDEIGLGIIHKNEARFYPFRILVYHEIVNDFIQSDPILITYCPLCFTGIAFIREIDNEPVEFGVSGKLYNSELVMYDRETDSYWPQTLGKAVLGPSTGKVIKKIPTDTVKWGDWKKTYLDTKVLSKDTGFLRNYDGSNPYGSKGDFTDINLRFPLENKDSRLDAYEIVYGIELNGKFKAYKKSDLEQKSKIEDSIGGEKIIIKFDNDLKSAKVFKESGEQIVVDTLFWFAWYAFHPETELYTSG